MFTVICCCKDPDLYESVLAAGLSQQEPHQLLLHRNTEEENLPLPIVYNRLAAEAEGDPLLFVHQDVRLLAGALQHLGAKMTALEAAGVEPGLIGMAGATCDGWLHNGTRDRQSYRGFHVEVQTLDEAMFACCRAALREVGGFTEVEPLAWHCYGADLALKMRRAGRRNYVVDLLAEHVGPHTVTAEKLPALHDAQRWLANQWRQPIGTSGGLLKLVPGGSSMRILYDSIQEGRARARSTVHSELELRLTAEEARLRPPELHQDDMVIDARG